MRPESRRRTLIPSDHFDEQPFSKLIKNDILQLFEGAVNHKVHIKRILQLSKSNENPFQSNYKTFPQYNNY